MALPKKFSFKTRHEIQEVIRSGGRREGRLGHFYFRTRTPGGSRRFLAVISRRVAKESTARHLLKRRLDGLFSRHAAQFPEGLSLVLVVEPRTAAMPRKELVSAFQELGAIIRKTQP